MNNSRYLSFWGVARQSEIARREEDAIARRLLSLPISEWGSEPYIEDLENVLREMGYAKILEREGVASLTEYRWVNSAKPAFVAVVVLYNPPRFTWGVFDSPLEFVGHPATPIDTGIGADEP